MANAADYPSIVETTSSAYGVTLRLSTGVNVQIGISKDIINLWLAGIDGKIETTDRNDRGIQLKYKRK